MGSRNSQGAALVQKGRQHKMKISLVPWTGGKFRVVDTLYHLFPKHTSYYEPFFGSGAVLINKKRCRHETVGEYSRDLYMLHKVLSDPEKSRELRRRLRHQELNEEAFLKAKRILNEGKAQDVIEKSPSITDKEMVRIILQRNGRVLSALSGETFYQYDRAEVSRCDRAVSGSRHSLSGRRGADTRGKRQGGCICVCRPTLSSEPARQQKDL